MSAIEWRKRKRGTPAQRGKAFPVSETAVKPNTPEMKMYRVHGITPMYKIKYVPNKIGDGYVGMNCFAAKELGIPFPYSPDIILIWEGLDEVERDKTISHEKDEIKFMLNGDNYKEAHRKASLLEKEYVC